MFTALIEYEFILDKISTKTNLSENQTNRLIQLIEQNPTIGASELFDVSLALNNGEQYLFDGAKEYSLDPILNESSNINLMEITIPIIMQYIPKEVLGYLTEKHAKSIVESIVSIEFNPTKDTTEDLRNRIDEMFASGDMTIPIQGLRKEPRSIEVIMNGVFAPMLYKNIQFDSKYYDKSNNSTYDNNSTLKKALKDYKPMSVDTPLSKLLPKFVMVLKNLIGDEK